MHTIYILILQLGRTSYNNFRDYPDFCLVTDKDKTYLQAFGANLKRIREEKGFTQAQLAIDSSLDISYISRIENGKISPSLIYIKHLADALQTDIRQLFVGG